MNYYSIPKEWVGETVFIIGGGPSLTQADIDSVRGRRSIAVNMSYINAPWADILFYADKRFWDREMAERPEKLNGFGGRVLTVDVQTQHPKVGVLRRVVPTSDRNGMSNDPITVAMERTSVQGAMNIAYLMGAKRIVLLGVDNRDAENGRIHHHDEYPWVRHNQSWDIKGRQFGYGAAALAKANVEVINCSMVSTLTFWPKRPLAEVLND